MGKAEVGSAKWLGNKIKSKGSLKKDRSLAEHFDSFLIIF